MCVYSISLSIITRIESNSILIVSLANLGNPVTKSIAIKLYTLFSVSENYSSLYSLYLLCFVLLYVSHFQIYSSISLRIPFQIKSLVISSIILAIPLCLAIFQSYLDSIIYCFYAGVSLKSIITINAYGSSYQYKRLPFFSYRINTSRSFIVPIQSDLLLSVSTYLFSVPQTYIILKLYNISVLAYLTYLLLSFLVIVQYSKFL